MTSQKKASSMQAVIYAAVLAAFLFLFHVGDYGEPYGLAFLFACLSADLSFFLCGLFYLLSAAITGEWLLLFLYLGQAVLLCAAFAFKKKLSPVKLRVLTFSANFIALALFVILAPFQGYETPFGISFFDNALTQSILLCAFIFLLSAAFTVALKALLRKLLKCRLRAEEILFCILLFFLTGVGICKFLSVIAYTGIAFFFLLVMACVTKDASALVGAFVLALPSALVGGVSPERFFIYGVAVVLFAKSGRLAQACAALVVFFYYGFMDGVYDYPTAQLVKSVLSMVLPCLFFLLLPAPFLHRLEDDLVFYREKHLSRVAINRNRAAIGEQLFEISAVFREIQTTFTALGSSEAEDSAKEYIRGLVVERVCKKCSQYAYCAKSDMEKPLSALVSVGCLKGKVNLIDIPTAMAQKCVDQSGVLYAVNRQIGDFRKYMLEAENAASGRTLLANQAQGISEILRGIALEQSEPLRLYKDKERALDIALLKAGIVCSEVLIYGEERDFTLSLIAFGNASVKKIADVASALFGTPMIISKRLPLSKDKYCCILRKKPYFDAAFGVASATKYGETASGDTHSVTRIDERRFMVALSDGMGSGEYARKISESTISLLESFYRAKMPSPLILSTVNKLLSFNREESFACVDIAVVDLDSGEANIVKIGSPLGFILSGNALKILESASLPLGVLDSLRPDSSTYVLKENDVLLFLSDGITTAFGSSADLYEALKTIPASNPQELANTLLERAIQAYGNVAKDDMTVVAVRLFKSAS